MSELVSFLKTENKPPFAPDDYYNKGCSQTINTIDGVKYCTFTKPDGDSITINESANDVWYERYRELIEKEFPNAPFSISLSDEELLTLDDSFTDEHTIIIKDERASCINYYWENSSQSELNEYISHIVVEKKEDNPITLRQILNVMINSSEYQKMKELEESHMNLECFKKTTKIQYVPFFGS